MYRHLLGNSCRSFRRPYSTVSRPAFTSFFFHNAQWKASARPTSSVFPTAQISAVAQPSFKRLASLTPIQLCKVYAQLAKSRLTFLVVLSAMASVAVHPFPTTLPVLLSTALGTTLCSASANTLNQIQEVPFDAQMTRTRNRPLVRRVITPVHAAGFALVTGVAGPVLLWTMVNPTTACLGIANIALYAGVYTWMKRKTIANTWVGAVVGGIPPLMGWTACGGHILPSSTSIHLFLPSFLTDGIASSTFDPSLIDNPLSALALFTLLYSWQFPHFNSLCHIMRESYAQAGYKMIPVFSPEKNALVAFRHAAVLASLSIVIPLSGLTTWTFAITSMVPSFLLLRTSHRFWRHTSEKEARALWQHCLWYLPAILGLMMFHKQGVEWLDWIGVGATPQREEHESS
ncbi:protoheme IX farnesyltransferase [Crepidotus variabilis]|uniref:Protoheme IX farnesyltransferase, mitochondrial n=1 Tax=Crepidotus variabilis TaxID=179855 RepID=A0A9P6E6P1_9AGAR|nr:protoheme IX farnesyltransferase [Crepidotus variabilis]